MTRVEKPAVTENNSEGIAFQNFDTKYPVENTDLPAKEEKNVIYLDANAEVVESPPSPTNEVISEPKEVLPSLDETEMMKRSQERTNKLKNFNFDLTKPIEDIEEQINIPAYQRLNMQLDDEGHSSERISSNTSINTDLNNQNPLFNTNNTYFNPKVD